MTLRDYECQACHAEFEAECQAPEWEAVCPKCGSTDTARLWRVPAVIYRGSGFYSADNRKVQLSDATK